MDRYESVRPYVATNAVTIKPRRNSKASRRVLRREYERERELEALARSTAWKADGAHDPRHASLDVVVTRGVLDDLDAFDVTVAHHRKAHGYLAGERRLVAESRFIAAVDLPEVLADFLADHECIDRTSRKASMRGDRQERTSRCREDSEKRQPRVGTGHQEEIRRRRRRTQKNSGIPQTLGFAVSVVGSLPYGP